VAFSIRESGLQFAKQLHQEPVLPIDPSTAFVSYARGDLEFVLRLAKDLKTKGAKVWMDKLDIRPGQRWEQQVEAALNGCSRMLVIVSPTSIASKNVLAEAAYAIDEDKEVIPVFHQDCKMPFRLRPFQYADFRTDYATGFDELLASLGTLTDSEKGSLRRVESDDLKPPETKSKDVAPPDVIPKGLSASVAESYRKAVAGDTNAMVDVGLAYGSGNGAPKDNQQAISWYRRAAEAGHSQGMYNLGHMYEIGEGLKQDYNQAANWYREAAAAGNASGMVGVGFMYENGFGGLSQDNQQAVFWYRKAADEGNTYGMTNLGLRYYKGAGVPQDFQQAVSWYRKAAEAGNPLGMASLGFMYENGSGVEKDKQQAISWYRMAAQLGNDYAKGNLKRLGESP
jgi:TPR repeat protein